MADKVVQAQAFELVNDEGVVRAAMKITANGSPALTMFDKDGNTRFDVSFGNGNDGSDGSVGVSLHGVNGEGRLFLSIGEYDQPSLSMLDSNETVRLIAIVNGTQRDSPPLLTLFDEGGNPLLVAEVSYVLQQSAIEPRAILTIDGENGSIALGALDKSGRPSIAKRDRKGKISYH